MFFGRMKTLETKVVIHIDTPHVWEYVRALASSCFEGYEGGGGGETRMLLPKLRLNMNDSGAGTRLNKRKWKDYKERREKAYLQKHLHHFLIDSKTLVSSPSSILAFFLRVLSLLLLASSVVSLLLISGKSTFLRHHRLFHFPPPTSSSRRRLSSIASFRRYQRPFPHSLLRRILLLINS